MGKMKGMQGKGAKSAPQGTATGSGSKVTGGKIPIPTSAPKSTQKLRK